MVTALPFHVGSEREGGKPVALPAEEGTGGEGVVGVLNARGVVVLIVTVSVLGPMLQLARSAAG